MLKKLFIIFVLIFSISPAFAFETQAEMIEFAVNRYNAEDMKMNQICDSIKKSFASDKGFVNSLLTSQIAWKKFRNAEIKTLFPKTDDIGYDYGSNFSIYYYSKLFSMTQKRIEELKELTISRCNYVPYKAGDICKEQNLNKLFD